MLKTVKSRIIVFTLVILLILTSIFGFLLTTACNASKRIAISKTDMTIAYYAERMNKYIGQLEESAVNLSLIGEIFYYASNNNQDFLNHIVQHHFKENKIAIGGGLFYEPYVIEPKQKRFCSYAYLNKNKVIVDSSFSSEKYNYLGQKWYKTVKSGVHNGENIVWTSPYFDESGTGSLMTTVGVPVRNHKGVFIGMSTADWVLDSIISRMSDIKPTPKSIVLFADEKNDYVIALNDIINDGENFVGKPLSSLPWYKNTLKNKDYYVYDNHKYIIFIKELDNNMFLIVSVPEDELFAKVRKHIHVLFINFIISCLLIAGFIYLTLSKNVNKPIKYLRKTALEIGAGNLDKKMEIESPLEFAELAQSFNKMTQDIKEYITRLNKETAEKKKMESELNIAKAIQLSSLPNIFPPYANRNEFDIYASMSTAKEVGGDFYDFFFTSDNKFSFLIADVSGKGIPAALFMMKTSMLIKNLAGVSTNAEELITKVNQNLCQTNTQGFFVTLFYGVLDTETGEIEYINAGHNSPLIKRENEEFEYLKQEHDLVLGAMDGIQYHIQHEKLQKGDFIFLYTDGVTEALNKEQKLYGDANLKNTLNNIKNENLEVQSIISEVKNNLDEYTQGEEQADDITMLVLKYNGVNQVTIG